VLVDLTELAATAVEFYEPAAEQLGISLGQDCDRPHPVAGDPILLAQALSNLIDNALKYAPAQGRIVVSVRGTAEGAVQMAVTDNGPGIRDSEKAKVVERFYRGDASRGTPGAGLGLSLVQAVAKLHGSSLDLIDEHPGLRAVITLRRESPEPARAEPETSPVSPVAAAPNLEVQA
jgi:signal transduction histidine kinase